MSFLQYWHGHADDHTTSLEIVSGTPSTLYSQAVCLNLVLYSFIAIIIISSHPVRIHQTTPLNEFIYVYICGSAHGSKSTKLTLQMQISSTKVY